MDISGITSLGTSMSQSKAVDEVQIAVLKKAMDVSAQGALQLIQAASNVIPSNPPHLGRQIDTVA
jgi:hypothetical protein